MVGTYEKASAKLLQIIRLLAYCNTHKCFAFQLYAL